MYIAILAALLCGIVLGQRFSVIILLPATPFVILLVIAAGMIHHDEFSTIVMAAVLAGISLQVGYLLGSRAYSAFVRTRRASHKK